MPCGCPTDTKCECSFTKNAAGKTLKKFDCSMKGITSLKGMEIWKDAEYFDLSINKVWSGQEVYDLGKLKMTRSISRFLSPRVGDTILAQDSWDSYFVNIEIFNSKSFSNAQFKTSRSGQELSNWITCQSFRK